MRAFVILAALVLTACGAAAPPERPAPDRAVTVTGDVTLSLSTKIN